MSPGSSRISPLDPKTWPGISPSGMSMLSSDCLTSPAALKMNPGVCPALA